MFVENARKIKNTLYLYYVYYIDFVLKIYLMTGHSTFVVSFSNRRKLTELAHRMSPKYVDNALPQIFGIKIMRNNPIYIIIMQKIYAFKCTNLY